MSNQKILEDINNIVNEIALQNRGGSGVRDPKDYGKLSKTTNFGSPGIKDDKTSALVKTFISKILGSKEERPKLELLNIVKEIIKKYNI